MATEHGPAGSIEARVAEIREGRASATDWTTTAQERIALLEPEVSAWVALADHAAADAAERDSRPEPGPLQGVPIGVKDIIDVAGLPTRAGSSITSPEPVAESAACVAALEALGAVVQGKTVTTEFAYFTPGPTRNPRAPGCTPGGSSSGSAAAVAAGMVPLALGTQTAASVTRPASFCGVAGMVLARGSIDLNGIIGLSHTLDNLGLLTASVDDLAYVYRALFPDQATAATSRIVLWDGSDLGTLEPAMAEGFDLAVQRLRGSGIDTDDLEWSDDVRTLAEDHPVVMSYEAARARRDVRDRINEVSETLAGLMRRGLAADDEDYVQAQDRIERSTEALDQAYEADTIILAPATLGPAPQGLGGTGSPLLSRPWHVLGLPVVTVPGLTTAAGHPLGLQLVGRPGREASLLVEGARLERLVRGVRTQL